MNAGTERFDRARMLSLRGLELGNPTSAGLESNDVPRLDLYGLGGSALEVLLWSDWALQRAKAGRGDESRAEFFAETFRYAQAVGSREAAAALEQMASRLTHNDAALAALVREAQDLRTDWAVRNRKLISVLGKPSAERDPKATDALRHELDEIEKRHQVIKDRIATLSPELNAFAHGGAVSVEQVRASLRRDEALLLFASFPSYSYVWAVTAEAVRWMQLAQQGSIERKARILRCHFEARDQIVAGGMSCASEGAGSPAVSQLVEGRTGQEEALPLALAHEVYVGLFGDVDDMIRDKHLLIVPSNALSQLPFHALVTEAPNSAVAGVDAFRRAAWLARRNAITILPSASAIHTLRSFAKPSKAPGAYIGFGNPLVDGPDPSFLHAASNARLRERCDQDAWAMAPRTMTIGHGVVPLIRGVGGADIGHIRRQVPLPETAEEICSVLRDLGGSNADAYLGPNNTESRVKALSVAGELAKHRVIHFATHGALAGQLKGIAEPGLLLTPPAVGSATDDGYLSASEVADLKLDADLVILSACNTAAGGTENAEALSGLARAFFYAGARSLLVSHWAVDSAATAKLITGTIREMRANSGIGRAEALQRSMLAMFDNGSDTEVHPSFWAPFMLVGEGGAAPIPAREGETAKSAPLATDTTAVVPRTAQPKLAARRRTPRASRVTPKTPHDNWRASAFHLN